MNIYEKLVFTNERNQSVELSLLSDFILEGFEGRNGLKNSIITVKGVNQIGQTFISNNIEMRNITLTGKIFTDGADSTLVRVVNPMLKGTLTYTNTKDSIIRSIECVVEKCATTVKKGIKEFIINLTCASPYWQEKETVKELALKINMLEFPLDIPSTGVEYGLVTNKRLNVYNSGDVETPLAIEWVGAVVNPVVTNTTTNQFIKVNTTLEQDEKLIIYTHYGNKKVLKVSEDGIVTNAFSLIDLTSKFFNLAIGNNVISYSADSGADESTLFLHFNNQFIGV